jgi:hypothetical protein
VLQQASPQASKPDGQQAKSGSALMHRSGVQHSVPQSDSSLGQQTPSAIHSSPAPQQIVPQAGAFAQQVTPFRQPPGQQESPQGDVPAGQQTVPSGSSMH